MLGRVAAAHPGGGSAASEVRGVGLGQVFGGGARLGPSRRNAGSGTKRTGRKGDKYDGQKGARGGQWPGALDRLWATRSPWPANSLRSPNLYRDGRPPVTEHISFLGRPSEASKTRRNKESRLGQSGGPASLGPLTPPQSLTLIWHTGCPKSAGGSPRGPSARGSAERHADPSKRRLKRC